MSTTTQLLLLAQKVDLLETYMNWVIAGVTIIIGVIMAVFATIQFVYQRKSAEGEIKKAENSLIKTIDEELLKKESILKELIAESIEKVSSDLRQKIAFVNTDVARQFAIGSEKDDFHGASFFWWLSAAVGYSEANEDSLRSTCISAAKRQLEKVVDQVDTAHLLKESTHILNNLNRLRQKHPIEAELLEGIFRSKLVPTSPQSKEKSIPPKT